MSVFPAAGKRKTPAPPQGLARLTEIKARPEPIIIAIDIGLLQTPVSGDAAAGRVPHTQLRGAGVAMRVITRRSNVAAALILAAALGAGPAAADVEAAGAARVAGDHAAAQTAPDLATDPAALLLLEHAAGSYGSAQSLHGNTPDELVERWDLLCSAKANIETILRDFVNEDIAVELAEGREVWPLRLHHVKEECRIASAVVDSCEDCRELLLLREARRAETQQDRASAIASVAMIGNHPELWDEAFDAARQIEDPKGQSEGVRRILRMQALAGLWDEALSGAEATGDPDTLAYTLGSISDAQCERVEYDTALESALAFEERPLGESMDYILDASIRDAVLRDVARAQAEAGDFSDALSTTHNIRHRGMQSNALSWVAKAQADQGYWQEALGTVRTIRDRDDATSVRVNIAVAQARDGRTKEALATIRSIGSRPMRMTALSNIAREQAEAGRFDDALATVQSIDEWRRHHVLVAIAIAMANQGRVDDAMALAQSIEPPMMDRDSPVGYTPSDERPSAMQTIAVAQTKAGRSDEAEATAQSVPDAAERAKVFLAIAIARQDGSAWDEAVATAQMIENSFDRSISLYGIARAQAEAGRVAEAIMVLREMEQDNLRGGAFFEIAQTLSRQ